MAQPESNKEAVNVWKIIRDAPQSEAANSLRDATARFYVRLGRELDQDPADVFIICAGSTIDAIRDIQEKT